MTTNPTTDTNTCTDIAIGIERRHDTATTVVLAALVGLATVGAGLDALLDATGHPRLVALGLVLLAALTGTVRWVARRVRERREDAVDLIAGAAWRAEHMPHLADVVQLSRKTGRDRAGVA